MPRLVLIPKSQKQCRSLILPLCGHHEIKYNLIGASVSALKKSMQSSKINGRAPQSANTPHTHTHARTHNQYKYIYKYIFILSHIDVVNDNSTAQMYAIYE